jgi:hypothetical protein
VASEDPESIKWVENFSGFWSMWRDGLVKRGYKLLNSIHPKRLSLKSWMEVDKYDGNNIRGGWMLKQRQDGVFDTLPKEA